MESGSEAKAPSDRPLPALRAWLAAAPLMQGMWLRLGRRLCGAGLLDERDMLQRSLRLLWQCAEDPALPWI